MTVSITESRYFTQRSWNIAQGSSPASMTGTKGTMKVRCPYPQRQPPRASRPITSAGSAGATNRYPLLASRPGAAPSDDVVFLWGVGYPPAFFK